MRLAARGWLPDARRPHRSPGRPPHVGGALPVRHKRGGHRVFLRLHAGLRVLPERADQPSKTTERSSLRTACTKFSPDLAAQGAHNIELVTPTQFTHILSRVLERPVPGGLPVVWNSGGYESLSALRTLEGKVDIYLPDLKYVTPERGHATPPRRTTQRRPRPPCWRCTASGGQRGSRGSC